MSEVAIGDPVAIPAENKFILGGEAENVSELTVIIVSYNTKELTLKCLETLYSQTFNTRFSITVYDNASVDGSVEAIAAQFPDVNLIAANENIGFARANNVAAEMADTEWLLLLNPDTEVHSGAIDALLDFSRATPEAGITGGRTVFPDGSLNLASCWMRMTPWSLFCSAMGLSAVSPKSEFFNPEAIGGWERDSVREVDIVVGCFLMIRRALWQELGGFDLRYFMYGEEADLCLRARALGYRPAITPEAEIMHLVGASSGRVADKTVLVAKARATLMRDHWPAIQVPVGKAFHWLWAFNRVTVARLLALTGRQRYRDLADNWRAVWGQRHDWLRGYVISDDRP